MYLSFFLSIFRLFSLFYLSIYLSTYAIYLSVVSRAEQDSDNQQRLNIYLARPLEYEKVRRLFQFSFLRRKLPVQNRLSVRPYDMTVGSLSAYPCVFRFILLVDAKASQ